MYVCSRKIPFLAHTVHVHARISMQNIFMRKFLLLRINKQWKVKVDSSYASILNRATLSSLSVPDTTELTLSQR